MKVFYLFLFLATALAASEMQAAPGVELLETNLEAETCLDAGLPHLRLTLALTLANNAATSVIVLRQPSYRRILIAEDSTSLARGVFEFEFDSTAGTVGSGIGPPGRQDLHDRFEVIGAGKRLTQRSEIWVPVSRDNREPGLPGAGNHVLSVRLTYWPWSQELAAELRKAWHEQGVLAEVKADTVGPLAFAVPAAVKGPECDALK